MSDDDSQLPRIAINLYDYIDCDGDLLSIDVSEHYLVISVLVAGRTACLGASIGEPSEARKIAGALLSWADEKEGLA